MNNKYLVLFSLCIFMLISSCSKNDPKILSEYELDIISYFKEVALGFENGNSADVTRKWNSPMRIFLDGNPSAFLTNKVERTVNEINEIVTDGFFIELVNSSNLSNCQIFFGTVSDFIDEYPAADGQVGSNYAIFTVWWNNDNLNRARIFIDTDRTTLTQQESLILEEITQSLGLGRDSPTYPNSIFFETPNYGGYETEYANIDKELIRLLYHPDMTIGLDEDRVDELLRSILINE